MRIQSKAIKLRSAVTPKNAPPISVTDSIIYGISVGSLTPLQTLVAGYHWATSRYQNVSVLVGDSLYRITLEIQQGVHGPGALEQAKEHATIFVAQFTSAVGGHPKIIRTSEIMEQPAFPDAYARVGAFYNTSQKFHQSLDTDAEFFVSRQKKSHRLSIDELRAFELSKQYLMEEIAVYLVLAEKGYLRDVYCGKEIPTLAKIANGQLPGAPKALIARINVSLRPR